MTAKTKLLTLIGKAPKETDHLHIITPDEAARRESLTPKEIRRRMKRIDRDFHQAFMLLQAHPTTVTFFGSARFKEDGSYYVAARELARRVAEELSLTVASGAGPGIMEAANRGAFEAKGNSVGMAIQLPHEQGKNPYLTRSADFYYFFSRKVALTFTARAYIYFPGGFGTLDELFEVLTLKQTGKIPHIPIILFGTEFWQPLQDFIRSTLYESAHTINEPDMDLYVITDDHDEVLRILAKS